MWAGTRNGGLFRSLDGGASWSGDLSGPQIPARVVTRIESHPRKASRLIVTSGGAGLVSRSTSRARRYSVTHAASQIAAYPHIFLSEDNGVFWRPIDSPHMPNSACHAAIFETHKPYRLFVASDFGVWMTLDLSRWTDVSTTLPNVMISDLVYHHGSRSLTAATYGRGIWRAFL